MNLAEIRKKARRERAGGRDAVDGTGATGPSNSPVREEALPEAPLGIVTGGDDRSAPEPPRERPPRRGSPVNGTDASSATPFDPLSIILAGRLAGGTAAEGRELPADAREDAEGILKYLRFRAADEEYGVSLLEIREIIKPRPVTEVPGMPGFVLGIISLRGIIMPVMDLRLRLGLPVGEMSGPERIIVAMKGEGIFGLLVDEVFQVMGLYGSEIEKAPPVLEGIDREFVRGIGRHGERMLIILDLEKVMDVTLR